MERYKRIFKEARIKKINWPHKEDTTDFEFYLKDKDDKTADDFTKFMFNWARKNKIIPMVDTKHNESWDINAPAFTDKGKNSFSIVSVDIKKEYADKFEKWLKTEASHFLK
jgi:enolase